MRVQQFQRDREALSRGAADASADARRTQQLSHCNAGKLVAAMAVDSVRCTQVLCAEESKREWRRKR